MISSKGGIKKMSNLQQATVTVKSILDALHSTNLKIESFVIMAISMESPLSSSFLDRGIETMLDGLLQNNLSSATMSNWVISQAMKIYQKEMSNRNPECKRLANSSWCTSYDILSRVQSLSNFDLKVTRPLVEPILNKVSHVLR